MKKLCCLVVLLLANNLFAQKIAPELSSWLMADGSTGQYYNQAGEIIDSGVEADVQSIHYTCDSIWISATGVPAYTTGPFLDGNMGLPDNQNWLFRISRNPVEEMGTKTEVPLGAIGVLINGTIFENFSDGMSFDDAGVWNRNTNFWDLDGFDCSRGHTRGTAYHHHQNPAPFNNINNPESQICSLFPSDGLYTVDPTMHSPLIGYSFDGFPLYGPYGYADPMDNTSGLTRMRSSYGLRDITERTTLADGTEVEAGPPIESFELGAFKEDFDFFGDGDLDEHNGRWCVTPEYPCGTYAYFATQDAMGRAAYPFFIGPTYFGLVEDSNFTIGQGTDSSIPEEAATFENTCNLIWEFDPSTLSCEGDLIVVEIETEISIADACDPNVSLIDGSTLFVPLTAAGEMVSFELGDGNCCSEIVAISIPSDVCTDCEGVLNGPAVPGSSCDDGDTETEDDVYQVDCTCAGTAPLPPDCEGVSGGPAIPGTPCDDNDPATLTEVYQLDCSCAVGTVEDCEGEIGGFAIPGTPCDDYDSNTFNDIWLFDCNCVGSLFECDFLNLNPGDPCNDFNPLTINDVVQETCICSGSAIDCEGTMNGTAFPTTPCDDGDPNTTGDVWDDDCICSGLSLGIEDVQESLVVFPNPVQDYLLIQSEIGIDRFVLNNINGQVLLSGNIDGLSNFEINMTNFVQGIYFLSIFKEGDFITQKVLKD